jgi:hypothetical protein
MVSVRDYVSYLYPWAHVVEILSALKKRFLANNGSLRTTDERALLGWLTQSENPIFEENAAGLKI